MDRKNSMLLWRAKDIVIFILFIVGLSLLLVYGSKAISAADDRRYVEGWRNQPLHSDGANSLEETTTPTVLAHILPMPVVDSQTSSQQYSSDAEKTTPPVQGQGNGLLKHGLPEIGRKVIK